MFQALTNEQLNRMTDAELAQYEQDLSDELEYKCIMDWTTGNLTFKMHSGQHEIWELIEKNEAQEFLLFISRQWGKSWLGLLIAISFCIRNPRSIVRVAAPTLKQASDIVTDNLTKIISDAPIGLIKPFKSMNRWKIGESELRLGVLERAHVDSLRGGNAKLVILEEGGFVKSEEYQYAVRSVIGPQLLRSKGRLLHISTPSEDPLHYIHTEVMPSTQLTNTCFLRDIYTNPQLNEEQILAAQKLVGGEDSSAWKREYLVQIVRDPTVVVVPEFEAELHVIESQLPEHSYWHTVIDFGGVRDKTAAVIVYYDFLRGKKVVIDELSFEPNTPTDVIVAGVLEAESRYHSFGIGKHNRIADVPGQTQIDLHSLHKFMIIPPVKDEWKAAINQLKVAIKLNEWEIHPRCKFLITSLTSGMFNKQKTDFARSSALGHCDAIAAMMYANRAIDVGNNPYPKVIANRDNQLDLRREKTGLQELGAALRPKKGNYFYGRN